MERILVVEDDIALSAGLCFELDESGYISVASYSCEKARRLLATDEFALVLLDVNLPDGNGFDLYNEIKASHEELPIIFLTANDLEEDILAGFDMGAEDYITKPFHVKILLKRIEVVLRRNRDNMRAGVSDHVWEDGFLRVDFESLTAVRGSEKLAITPNEYKILKLLTANAGNVVTRRLLLEKLWDCDENYIDDHTLTVNMNRLRGKIEDETHQYIKTIRGMGYIWTGNV